MRKHHPRYNQRAVSQRHIYWIVDGNHWHAILLLKIWRYPLYRLTLDTASFIHESVRIEPFDKFRRALSKCVRIHVLRQAQHERLFYLIHAESLATRHILSNSDFFAFLVACRATFSTGLARFVFVEFPAFLLTLLAYGHRHCRQFRQMF